MKATPQQKQRLLEKIFHRNYVRRQLEMPPINIAGAYTVGLNRILRENKLTQKLGAAHRSFKK